MDTTKKLEETLEQIVRMRHDPEFVRRAAKTALAWLSSAAPATEGERKAFESDLDELLRLAQSVSGWHAEYMGKVMPDRIYESFARQRDEQIPALRRKLIDVLVSKASAPDCGWSECPHGAECVHAKASAPEPVALTDEQIDALDTGVLHVMAPRGRESVREFARRIAALAASPSAPVDMRVQPAQMDFIHSLSAADFTHGGKFARLKGLAADAEFSVPVEAQAVPEWHPIETAPKDGTGFLGYWPTPRHDCSIHAIKWHKGRWWETNEDYPASEPTHWMPIPAAPTPSKGEA